MPYLFLIPLAYLLGAIPVGFLIGRAYGIDIRTVGSRNIGATNVMRSVGKFWGIITLLLDALKGLIPAALFPLFAQHTFGLNDDAMLRVACGCAAVLGHNFPVYLHFKGGKGIATTAGVLIGIAPAALVCGLASFSVMFGLFRMVSLGSLSAAIVIPTFAWLRYRHDGMLIPLVLTALGLLAIWRHRTNIQRLLTGTENRIQFGSRGTLKSKK